MVSVAVFAGWRSASWSMVPEVASGMLPAFPAGDVVHNVLKEECQNRFWTFALGAVPYAALLLAL